MGGADTSEMRVHGQSQSSMEITHTTQEIADADPLTGCALDHPDILLEICVRSSDDVIRTMSQVSSLWSCIRGFATSPFFWYRRTQYVSLSCLEFTLERNWTKMYDFLSYLRYHPGEGAIHTLRARWIATPTVTGHRGVVIRRREPEQQASS